MDLAAFHKFHIKFPLVTVVVCCALGLILVQIPDYGVCNMTYMWPNYFSVGDIKKIKSCYDLYLYKEGRHGFSNPRKAHLLTTSMLTRNKPETKRVLCQQERL